MPSLQSFGKKKNPLTPFHCLMCVCVFVFVDCQLMLLGLRTSKELARTIEKVIMQSQTFVAIQSQSAGKP